MYYLTLQDKLEVVSEINHTALFLYEFWISKLSVDNYDFSDEKASKALNMPVGSIRNNRLLLTKFHYFIQHSGKVGGQKALQTYLGKQAIIEWVILPAVFGSSNWREIKNNNTRDTIKAEILNHVNDTNWTEQILEILNEPKE
jgi:hypothetical protein